MDRSGSMPAATTATDVLAIGAAPAAVLIWRVAGAVPDAVVAVPGPIASTPFVEQAVQRSGGRHPDLQAKDPPVTMTPICTPILPPKSGHRETQSPSPLRAMSGSSDQIADIA